MSKEQNFISAVVYLDNTSLNPEKFIGELIQRLDEHFMHYEIIAVNNGAPEEACRKLKALRSESVRSAHISVINMSVRQSREQCMNAGLDISTGDYVYEFDSDEAEYDLSLIWRAYQSALQGSDIVEVCPDHESRSSRAFYRIFNACSNSSYKLRTNAFTLISRRALNRAHDSRASLSYRKAVYALTGLKMSEIIFPGKVRAKEKDRFTLAADSLALYTDFGYKFSLRFAFAMMLATMAAMLYTVSVWLAGSPVSGWTTTMFVLTFGLTGIFAALAMVMKYLALVLRLSSGGQGYLVESIEKV